MYKYRLLLFTEFQKIEYRPTPTHDCKGPFGSPASTTSYMHTPLNYYYLLHALSHLSDENGGGCQIRPRGSARNGCSDRNAIRSIVGAALRNIYPFDAACESESIV